MKKINNVFVADFETNNNPENASVWLWDICSVQTFEHIGGTSIEQFFDVIGTLAHNDIVVYFHNLKFDGTFILCYLLANGYTFVKIDDFKFEDKTFSCIIDSMKKFYSVSVKIGSVNVEFRDSFKKIPSSVDKIAKDFNLGLNKLEIDYDEYRDPYSHNPTEEEIAYIEHDTEIIAIVINQFYKEGMTHLTLSSDCFNLYKKMVGKDNFDIIYPVLDTETDTYIRRALFGGICYANETYKEIRNVYCYDVNSMYPSIMYNELLPYGIPIKGVGKPIFNKNKLYVIHMRIALNIKSGFFPFYMTNKRGFFIQNEFIKSTDGEMLEIWITNPEYELLTTHYDYEVEFIDFLEFKASRNLFKKYIGPIYAAKSIDVGAKRQLDKFKLNMLYGRFGLNPLRVAAIPYLEDGILKFKNDVPTYVDSIYTAISVFVAAGGRVKLAKAIQENYDHFVYCDTDSMFLTEQAKGIAVDSKKLGAWDLEKKFDVIKVIGAKTYCGVLDSGKKIVKVCGAPANVKDMINMENFAEGLTLDGKLLPKNVKGGVVLKETLFTIKNRSKRF